MAFQSQPFFLKKGESIGLVTTFGIGDADLGAQYFMASPRTDLGLFPQSGNAGFEVSRIQKWSWYSSETGFSYFSYTYTVTNVGDIDTNFVVDGGGNV
ncbi:MAG TPA: hypothetical protein VG826_01275 [Pirellulales bacterium]|nr:hypothetical protein [Pirellulales bacterium]